MIILNILIRKAESQEIPIVHQIMRLAFEEYRDKIHPQSGALREEISDIEDKVKGTGGTIIVLEDLKPIGSAQYYFKDDYMYIGRVSVITEARGLGLGTRMMKFLEGIAIDNFTFETRLEVRLSIPQNIEFYRKLNYEVIEQREYPDGTDKWYVMRKKLLC